ncbi:MAG: hypothetical protein KJ907_13755 [Actinobacteria bacterium]|nr:hypothetical protein [Actinomycetota bacterium]
MKEGGISSYQGIAKGAYKATGRSGWRYCVVSLDEGFLVCEFADGHKRFISLDRITDARVEQHRMGIGKKPVLVIEFKHQSGTRRNIWLNLKDPDSWKERITDLCLHTVEEEDILDVAAGLGPASADLLLFLHERGHATIDELVDITGASCHMDVIILIKKEINPAFEKRLGRPMVEFVDSRLDPETGELVRLAWWLRGERHDRGVSAPAPFDVIDEGDFVRAVIEPVKAAENDLAIGVVDSNLLLSWPIGGKREERTVPLPEGNYWEGVSYTLNNGVLDIHVRKAGFD